nr:hypothetical protein BaRGS_003709 [Batillaria attramentaria]
MRREGWQLLGEPPSPRSGHAGALLKDKVYIFGGQQRENVMNDLYCLDLSNPRPVWELPATGILLRLLAKTDFCCSESGNVLVFGGCVDNILGYDGNMPVGFRHGLNHWNCKNYYYYYYYYCCYYYFYYYFYCYYHYYYYYYYY